MAKESQLWEWLRQGIAKQFAVGAHSGLRLDRLESPITPGFPDVSYTYLGTSGHIELKSVPALPKRPTTRVFGDDGCSQEQKNWHKREADAGGFHYILGRAGAGKERRIWLIHGAYADEFNDMNVSDLNRASRYRVTGDWSAQDWMILMTCLKTRRHGEEME